MRTISYAFSTILALFGTYSTIVGAENAMLILIYGMSWAIYAEVLP